MNTYGSPEGYLYNLHTCSPSEAKRMWKKAIKEQWGNKCAYCGSDTNLTLDHIVPRSKGGSNHTTNVLCACESCNADKAYTEWIIWYIEQPFFTEERREAIEKWMFPTEEVNPNLFVQEQPKRYSYGTRRTRAY
ncbi:HNH endonuclease [Synechococcus phage S-CAM7]|jgi:hypothetical protein|uniref:Putative endonuclease n=1 Tax=Synechococcus phage S-CAM7 TaxID=1883368 RepID=A0A1D8KU48_9CAUD|nr:HNH endonuclease [Synechococcus phage S-CAM7]AOV62172.1 putative endonuclease [Synechococcus phage S-CAM7]QLF86303.1 hypothetical protein CC030809_00255 [Synechococcus phage S-CAM7]